MNATTTEPTMTTARTLDPFNPDPEVTSAEWRAEQDRLAVAGDTQRSHACGWVAYNLESRAATARIRNGTGYGGTGPAEITRYGERCAGPEGDPYPRRRRS